MKGKEWIAVIIVVIVVSILVSLITIKLSGSSILGSPSSGVSVYTKEDIDSQMATIKQQFNDINNQISLLGSPDQFNLDLSSTGSISKTVTFFGNQYNINLISATNMASATIRVNNDTKTITVGTSKVVGGMEIYITGAKSNNVAFAASGVARALM